MAEHGFTGAFNDELVDAAHQAMQGGEALFVIGSRGRLLIEERGLTIAWATDMAIHAGTVTDTARRIADELYRRFDRGGLAGVEILYFRDRGGGRRVLDRQSLLPIDLEQYGKPRSTMPPQSRAADADRRPDGRVRLRAIRACCDGKLCQRERRSSRRDAVGAEKLDERLTDLQSLERRLRQEQITTELLEIVTGTEAAR